MSRPLSIRGALFGVLTTLSLVSCGSSSQADLYFGVDFATDGATNVAFDSKFLGQVCGNSGATSCRNSNTRYACATSTPCYIAQEGFANGSPVYFYNLVQMGQGFTPTKTCIAGTVCTTTGAVPNPIPVSVADPGALGGGGAHVDVFPHSCVAGPAFNAERDAYTKSVQFPIFNALPTFIPSTDFGGVEYPIVAQYGVSLTSNETCNDLKDSSSIANASNPGGGSYGATRTAQPTSYQLWAAIDPNAIVLPLGAGVLNPNYGVNVGWYQGLLVPYLDGGPIPTQVITNADGSTSTILLAMDGLLVDPAGSSFSDVTDQKTVLLPAAPGDTAYSPIVRLHDYHLQSGQTIGTVTSICQPSDPHPCPATSADYTKASANPFYMIFIVSTPQQTQ